MGCGRGQSSDVGAAEEGEMSETKHANSAEEIVAYWNRNPIEYFFHISGPDLRVVIAEWTALRAENGRLREALDFLMTTKWKSVDGDNMEYEGRVTCYQLDKARAALSCERAGGDRFVPTGSGK